MKAHIPMSKAQQKGMKREIDRQTAENVKRLSVNLSALVLWSVRQQLGFGKKRLLRFHKNFLPLIQELQNFYLSESDEETAFVCIHNLKEEVGIDVNELDDMFKIQARYTK